VSFKVAVLLGGTSAERDVSLISGREISKALRLAGHEVLAVDCAFGDHLIKDWDRDINEIIRVEYSDFESRKNELDRNILKTIQFLLDNKIQVVFIGLHGGYGENGQIQALLDLAKICYTGSGALASGIGMNKNISKVLFQKYGVSTAPWVLLESPVDIPREAVEQLGYPLVIKPNDQGSTVGLTVVQDSKKLDEAISLAFRLSDKVLAEKFIEGKEVTVSILDTEALPVIEIIPEHGIYDYECKYQKGKSQYIVPAELPDDTTTALQEQARKAYSILGCRHYARVDFRLSRQNKPFCLEVNTLPGMTATSLVPKAAKARGMDFTQLVDKIVQLASEQNPC
jgi:D-alanine-D-alanine ligase